ncbi:type IV secretory system conjugative DNA transfer family protein [Streptomyces sp. cmx-10-25]|uniref:type IV secretory system conjugative DNA transfer family protein n=1 Tax=Streptomyces sp. cmx-10-25 TaxID=2790919 RepID=UPI0039813653
MANFAAPWDGWDLSDYALPGGSSLLALLLLLAYVVNDKGGRRGGGGRPNEELNRQIEAVVGGAARGIGRYVGGRDLAGEPRSTATWWRSGVLVSDDAAVSALADTSALSLAKESPSALRSALLLPLRVVASMGRALAAWSRWPHAARSLVRLAPFAAAWGWWRHPEAAELVAIGAAGVVLVVAFTGPGGLGWWAPRMPTDDETLGPAVWAGVRQVLRLDEKTPRTKWLRIDPDLSADGSRIVLRLPLEWMGGKEAMGALQHIVDTRIPGEWVAKWERSGASQYVQWTRKPAPAEKPILPDTVEWKPTGNRFEVFLGSAIEGDRIVDVVVQTKSATPHWGVAGNTGSGKSTLLYIPVVHGRQYGELIDILDTKQNSLIEAEGFSGIRIHKTVRSCVAAFAEFMVSMMAAESAMGKDSDPAARALLVPRTLVIDELPTLIKLAYVWWRYGLKGKGAPPFLDWFSIILLQGRSSDHRIVVGTQQFANTFFGGTMERAQIGTKAIVGAQDRVSWGVAFGQATPVIQYDTDIKGRGVLADTRQDPDTGLPYVREFQPAYITPHVARLLAECPPAPEWFDRGEMAPWITDEALTEAHLIANVKSFLPGGKYGPDEPVTSVPMAGVAHPLPSSSAVTAAGVTTHATARVTGGPPAATDPVGIEEDRALPRTLSLAKACEEGVVPWKYGTARQYKKRSEERGIVFPAGVTDGRTSYYTEEELREWVKEWSASKPPLTKKNTQE